MAPKYKLIYFDAQGAAEHIRYIFAYANQGYEDVRIKREDWPSLKPNTPFGKVPVLEIDGKQITQSSAIARYVANQFGLVGKDAWESLQCDILVDTLKDMVQGIYRLYSEQDPQKKEEIKKNFLENEAPFYLGKFDKIIADNPAGLLVGSEVTWADLTFAAGLGVFTQLKPDFVKPYPALEELLDKINNIPAIKAWIKKRPENKIPITL